VPYSLVYLLAIFRIADAPVPRARRARGTSQAARGAGEGHGSATSH
jgi:hypothetical protein